MKRISTNLRSITSRLCMAALALLGFSCSSDSNSDNEEDIAAMYGTPTSTFEVKGSVTNTEGEGVADATIIVTYPDAPSDRYRLIEGTTAQDGSYKLNGIHPMQPTSEIKVVCLPAEAGLDADSTYVRPEKVSEGEGWSNGKGAATVNFVLKEKSAE